jgi:uncharacterized protein (DUF427 family)
MNSQASTSTRPMKFPGPDHTIVIESNADRIVVTVAKQVIADTRAALNLSEAGYPSMFYIPRSDVNMALLARSNHSTYCPYKGECNYYHIPLGGERSLNAAWTYEDPYPAVHAIKDYLAFYSSRVDYD